MHLIVSIVVLASLCLTCNAIAQFSSSGSTTGSPRESSLRDVLVDDFDDPQIDPLKWIRGEHPGNLSGIENGQLRLHSSGETCGWIYTRKNFALRDLIAQIKVVQLNDDGALGLSPTVTRSSPIGFLSEPNAYHFYTYRPAKNEPYRLYVQWRKAGIAQGHEVASSVELKAPFYMRIRTSREYVYFEYSFDGEIWNTAYGEEFSLPDLTPDDKFHFELTANHTAKNGDWMVDDFRLQTTGESEARQQLAENIVLQDALNGVSKGVRTGGQFVAGLQSGWQTTGREDMIVYDLVRYIENGSLELTVRNFKPSEQNSAIRHHFLSMFRFPWGSHHSLEKSDTFWDLHAGTAYSPGVKMQSSTTLDDELATVISSDWNKDRAYRLKVIWNGNELQYFCSGVLEAIHRHDSEFQLRYLFLGRDLTVSGDLVTGFKNNQYPTFVGPIYSDLVIKEYVPSQDVRPAQIIDAGLYAIYANAVRLEWSTDEPASCYVEYGTSSQYGMRTRLLGPPDQHFITALANLSPGKTYHYRMVALDDAGNQSATEHMTFMTADGELYLFMPGGDTFVENASSSGGTRNHGNFGWTNLIGGQGRECYLRFEVSAVRGRVTQSALRLFGRQSGKSGGALHLLERPWEEPSVTWLNKPFIATSEIGIIPAVRAGEWNGTSLGSLISGDGVYSLAIVGSGAETVSWDSRESINHQPELVLVVSDKDDSIPPLFINVTVRNLGSNSASISWETDEPATSLVSYGHGNHLALAGDSTDYSIRHVVNLHDLEPHKEYRFHTISTDVPGNRTVSPDNTFETSAAHKTEVTLHELYEVYLTAKNAETSESEVSVTFKGVSGAAAGESNVVQAFHDEGAVYVARFVPTAMGEWSWSVAGDSEAFTVSQGRFICQATAEGANGLDKGHIQVSTNVTGIFLNAQEEPVFFLGHSMPFSWDEVISPGFDFSRYLENLISSGCSFVQLPVQLDALQSNEAGQNASRKIDEMIIQINRLGMVAGVSFTPGPELRFASRAEFYRLVQYLVNRYAAFNVFWVIPAGIQATGELPEQPDRLSRFIQAIDPYQHPIVADGLEAEAMDGARTWYHVAVSPNVGGRIHTRSRPEVPILFRQQTASAKHGAEEMRRQAWLSTMAGGFFLHAGDWHDDDSKSTSSCLRILREFWTSDLHHAIRWWEFKRFEPIGKAHWLAGNPGVDYVVYCENTKEIRIDLSDARGEIRGEWFNTKTGLWGAAFSGEASRSFPLKAPDEGYVGYVWVHGGGQ